MLTESFESPNEQDLLCCGENPSSKCDVSCNVTPQNFSEILTGREILGYKTFAK